MLQEGLPTRHQRCLSSNQSRVGLYNRSTTGKMVCLGTISCLPVIYVAISNRIHSFFLHIVRGEMCRSHIWELRFVFLLLSKNLIELCHDIFLPFRLLPSFCRSKAVSLSLTFGMPLSTGSTFIYMSLGQGF